MIKVGKPFAIAAGIFILVFLFSILFGWSWMAFISFLGIAGSTWFLVNAVQKSNQLNF